MRAIFLCDVPILSEWSVLCSGTNWRYMSFIYIFGAKHIITKNVRQNGSRVCYFVQNGVAFLLETMIMIKLYLSTIIFSTI